jgi:hypothetical protein
VILSFSHWTSRLGYCPIAKKYLRSVSDHVVLCVPVGTFFVGVTNDVVAGVTKRFKMWTPSESIAASTVFAVVVTLVALHLVSAKPVTETTNDSTTSSTTPSQAGGVVVGMNSPPPTTIILTKLARGSSTNGTYYISVTGIELKSIFHHPLFWRHAIPSAMVAQQTVGNMHTQTGTINGVQHTYTVWNNRTAMQEFLRSTSHRHAMSVTKYVGRYGKIYGAYHDTIPTWNEAIQLWRNYGTIHVGKPESKHGDL